MMSFEEIIKSMGKVSGRHFIMRRTESCMSSTFKGVRRIEIKVFESTPENPVFVCSSRIIGTVNAETAPEIYTKLERRVFRKLLRRLMAHAYV